MRRALVLIAVLALGCGDDSESDGKGGTGGATGGTGGATGGSAGMTGGAAGSGGATGGAAGTGGASGGTGGASGGTGGASGGTGGGTGGTGGTGGGCGSCDFVCCGSACTNTGNDIKNCGGCGTECKGNTPYCDNGACKDKPPCESGTACSASEVCCGKSCCGAGQICCDVPSSVGQLFPQCHTPVGGTCPKGCTKCVCNSPDTPIATPTGNRAIASLREGDLVYSMDRGKMRAVAIRMVQRVEAPNHTVVRSTLASGVVLEISPRHPLADGRTFGDLRAGHHLDGVFVAAVERVAYTHSHTYDILPDSDTGTYFAGGVLIASTIAGATGVNASFVATPASR